MGPFPFCVLSRRLADADGWRVPTSLTLSREPRARALALAVGCLAARRLLRLGGTPPFLNGLLALAHEVDGLCEPLVAAADYEVGLLTRGSQLQQGRTQIGIRR